MAKVTREVAEGLGEFFDYVWGESQGWVYLPVIKQGTLDQYMLQWPAQRSTIIKHVLRHNAEGADAYYSPALFSKPQPSRENVKETNVLWADFDSTTVDWSKEKDVPEPTLIIESSPGREHVYWRLAEPVCDVAVIDERNRSIAYRYKADTSGWDANQFLRPPFTTNTGYGKEGRKPSDVHVQRKDDRRVTVGSFAALAPAKQVVAGNIDPADIPDIRDVIALGNWDERFWDLFNEKPENLAHKRSDALMRLGYEGAEHGFTDAQIYAILLDADDRWGKYKGRHDRERHLLDIINRARQKVGYNFDDFSALANIVSGLEDQPKQSSQIVFGFQEFLDADFHVDWLLEGLMALGGLGLITGPPGVGKTQIGIQMGISVALGEEFLGWKNETGKKRVLFLSCEMPGDPLSLFMETIAEHYTPEQKLVLSKNFMIAPIGDTIPFDRPEGQAFIDTIMQEYAPDVVFIDSLQKVLSEELTEEKPMRAFTKYMQKFRLKYKCSVYMIHHNRKEQQGSRAAPSLDDIYGNRFLTSDLDFALNVRQILRDIVRIDTLKNRLAMQREPFDLKRDQHLHYTFADPMTQDPGIGNDNGTIFRDSGNDESDGPSGMLAV